MSDVRRIPKDALQEIADLKAANERLRAVSLSRIKKLSILDEGILNGGDAVSLTAQETHEAVLTKVISGLYADRTYKLDTWYGVALRPPSPAGGGLGHYQTAVRLDGTAMGQVSLHEGGTQWSTSAGSGYAEFTGKTSITITVTVYSYEVTGTGRYYYRHLKWQLREK